MLNNEKYDILEIRDYYPSINNPASSTWVYDQVISLTEMGFKPLVISPTPINPLKKFLKEKFHLYDSPSIDIEIYNSTQVIRPPYFKIPNNKLIGITLYNLSRCVKKYGNKKSIKLIHAHFGQNGIAAIVLKRSLKVPLITSFYGYDTGRLASAYRPYYRQLINEGDRFLVLSQDMKNDLLKLGFPEDKIGIHHLGIDLKNFSPISIKKEVFSLLTVARLDEVKGIQFVLEALRLFNNKYPKESEKIQYKIIGGGKYENSLISLVKSLRLDDNVIFINNLILTNSREIVREEMKNCDLFVLCSYTTNDCAKEGTPVVLMEAQACGKPCLATFHAGIPEVVKNNESGILVKEKSVEEILQALETFFFNKKIRIVYGKKARIHISIEFNQSIQMMKLVKLYNTEIMKYGKNLN